MTYPLVTDLADEGVPVRRSCAVLGFSPQAYFKWRANPVSQRDWDDAHVINAAFDIHDDDPTLGSRFITDKLLEAGIIAGENRVAKLCSLAGIFSITSKKGRKGRLPGPAVHDDLVQRNFTASAPNRLWLVDITEHPTNEGKLYLCAIKDCYSNRIVGYSMSHRMRASLAVNALTHALANRRPVGPVIVHSDRGSQFRSRKFVRALAANGLLGSMGRVGAAADNAAMESFFSLLQKNVLNLYRWQTRAHLREEITYWIEAKYHRGRRQRALGKQTPIEFEKLNQAASAA
jgi:transposase InsO family protein